MSDDSTARAIRRLTAAIWALAFLVVLSTLAHLLLAAFFSSESHMQQARLGGSVENTDVAYRDKYEGFHDWPVERQIASASAILMTKHRIEGEELISTVSEVLKLDPGTALYYEVGAEYKRSPTTKGTTYGDGEVVFLAGSPAQMRYSVTCSAGRCEGLGGIPLDTLRKLISNSADQAVVPKT
jgi:hypothetical protein